MFHRVKSEVQGSEQKSKPVSESTYRQNTVASEVAPQERKTYRAKAEDPVQRYNTNQRTEKEEEVSMRSQEDTQVQGKYARPTEEASSVTSEETKDHGYQSASSSRSGGYNGGSSYSGTSSYASSRAVDTAPYAAGPNDRQLTIGRGINMSGEIEACDHLLVEGTVEAALKGAKLLDIAESGTFYGTVEIEEATIAGRFEGDITVNGRLTIKASGTITGSIAYRELEVEAGAVLDGRMTPLKGNVDQKSLDKYRAGTSASTMAKAKEVPALKKDDREPANADHRLFSKAHASH